MTPRPKKELVLAIFLPARGFSFVLLEAPLSAIDWGTREIRGTGRHERCLDTVCRLVEKYQPDVVVIEEWRARHSTRTERIRRLYRAIETRARKSGITVYPIRRRDVVACFERFEARTKHHRAVFIAEQIPAFSYRVPPPRKLWKSEHPRMGVFEASALAIVHSHVQ